MLDKLSHFINRDDIIPIGIKLVKEIVELPHCGPWLIFLNQNIIEKSECFRSIKISIPISIILVKDILNICLEWIDLSRHIHL
jgi:hypothetical protein